VIEALGLTPVMPPSLLTRPRDLAGSVRHRLDELHQAFADASIQGVFCARGGYGVSEIIADVDYDLIGRNPKVFLGFSDLTSLHLAIRRRTGLVTFHGRMPALSRFPQYSLDALRRAVCSPEPLGTVQNPSEANPLRPAYPLRTIVPGTASGPLTGGNLAMILATMGTPWEIDTRGAILFFEEVGETPYAIARMLLTLKHAGKLDQVAGIVVGACARCDEPSEASPYSLNEVFDQVLGNLKVPVFSGLVLGHTDEQLTLPVGVQARMDASKCALTVVEAGVIA
jgi:muramoyltetrapeptide carboxypeptidase